MAEALTRAGQVTDDVSGWAVLFEYEIPRRATRPDAVVLAGGVVIAIEFKVGSEQFTRADRVQVCDYARDLRDFHRESSGRPVVPVLCSTASTRSDTDLSAEPIEDRAQCVSPDDLGALLVQIADNFGHGSAIDPQRWDESPYRPTPTILQAALDIYAGHDVREITHAYADNLTATVDRLRSLIKTAQTERQHLVCFVTGVPGSGKTLAGLSSVHSAAGGIAGSPLGAYLSGNGPLVDVLR